MPFKALHKLIPTETKIDYLLSLLDGVKDIDFRKLHSAVPQMQDTPAVGTRRNSSCLGQFQTDCHPSPVLNVPGFKAAIESKDIRCVGYALSVSETPFGREICYCQKLEQAWAVSNQQRAERDLKSPASSWSSICRWRS
jgi:hypothetical protein